MPPLDRDIEDTRLPDDDEPRRDEDDDFEYDYEMDSAWEED